ncbi:MAG: DUF2341 domain-containing protein [Mucilaginibacter polytrichastri]|nr:DUF2341 domain-containing protein [Mucilaginibacter polytrichastri]
MKRNFFMLVLFLVPALSALAQFTLSNGQNYLYRRSVTIPKANVSGAANLANFPVLLDITLADLRSKSNCGKLSNEQAYDIEFTLSGATTALAYDIDSYTPATGRLLVWVRIPSLAASGSTSASTTLDFFYGGTGNVRTTNPSSSATWSSNYQGVWHLNETPSNAAAQLRDATPNGKHLQSTNSPQQTDGRIGKAVQLVRSSSQQLYASGTAPGNAIDLTGNFTLSAWIYLTSNNLDQKIMTNQGANGYKTGLVADGTFELETRNSGTTVLNRGAAGGTQLAAARWYYVTSVFDGASYKTYIDGALQRNFAATQAAGAGSTFRIGVESNGNGNYFNGVIDEPHVADVARPAEWIATEATNQGNPAAFATVSASVTLASGFTFWTGNTSGEWTNPANWSTAAVPSSTTRVVIGNGGSFAPTISTGSPAIGSLTVEACMPLTIAGGQRLTVNGDLTLNGQGAQPFATSSTGYGYINLGNSSSDEGNLTVSGNFLGDGFIYFKSAANSGNLNVFELGGNWQNTGTPIGVPSTSANMNVNYIGTSASATQTVYTGQPYYNLRFGNAATKQISGSVSVFGRWHATGGKVDARNATVSFAGSNQTVSDNASDAGNGVLFGNINFLGGGTKTINGSDVGTQTGKIALAPDGIMNISGNTTVNVQGARLIFRSDAGGSATLAAIPAGSSINSDVQVERFIRGSSNLSKRGYRLISSPVYMATTSSGLRTWNPLYILNSSIITGLGGTANGFTSAGNPTLYLYREDLVPQSGSFTSGNYKGISGLSGTAPFPVRTQLRNNRSNTSDTTVNIPVGTGMLFFFRGNKASNGTTSGSKTTLPFNFPEDVVFTMTGPLNQGTVSAQTWFTKDNTAVFPFSTSIANNIEPRNVRGFHLLGNPYASGINWNKLNRNGAASSLYAPNIEPAVWFFNPTNKQYEAYIDANPASGDTTNAVFTGTGSATNIIASGQGFFIRTRAGGSGFRFMEAAKTVSQAPASGLNKLMGVPAGQRAAAVVPSVRLRLIKDELNDDEVLIRFRDDAQPEYNVEEDAADMGGSGALISLSTTEDDGSHPMAIDTRPMPFSPGKIRLLVDATADGLYTMNRKELTGFPAHRSLWLHDHFTGDSLDIVQNENYTFRILRSDEKTFGKERFELRIGTQRRPELVLVSFEGDIRADARHLSWTTRNEYADTQFALEKMTGENSFTIVVERLSDSSGRYTFLDPGNTHVSATYRLKMTSVDGKVSYSELISLHKISSGFVIAPNPVGDFLKLHIADTGNSVKTLSVISTQGRILFRKTVSGTSLNHNVQHFAPGMYVVELRVEADGKQEIFRRKMIKM